MKKITFYKKNNFIIGFEITGHTGKDDYGKDLLCCQISTVAQSVVVGVCEIEKLHAFKMIKDGYLKLSIQEKDAQSEKIQFLMQTALESFKSIIIDEEKYAKLEVKNV